MFITRSLDKFSYRTSTQGIIVVEGQRIIKTLTTSELQYKSRDSSVQKVNTVCYRVKTLPSLSDLNYFLLPFICVENATRNLTSYCNFQG